MGRRHGEILTSLGDLVEYADLEFDPSKMDKYPSVDSLLLCTPAETHVGLIERLAYTNLPLFVEKPVLVFGDKEPKYPGVSMVACNWRWCACLPKDRADLQIGYPANQKYLPLDLVHFYDRFASMNQRFDALLITHTDVVEINLKSNSSKMRVALFRNCMTTFSILDDHALIHQIPCNMFVEQMKAWRDVVRGSPSPNPIDLATIGTKALISLIDNAVVVPSKPLH